MSSITLLKAIATNAIISYQGDTCMRTFLDINSGRCFKISYYTLEEYISTVRSIKERLRWIYGSNYKPQIIEVIE